MNSNRWVIAVLVMTMAIWGVIAAVDPDFNCNRWDNFEYFTPAIIQAHDQWLHGELPAINPHQSMGEPLLPTGTLGIFYFPYTLGVFLMHMLALPPQHLMTLLWCLHLPWAAVGVFLLCSTLGVRPAFGFLTVLSICLGGFVTCISMIWVPMLAVFAWLPWALWGLVKILDGTRPKLGGAVLAVSLAAVGCTGHAQMAVYLWLLVLLFTLMFGLGVYRRYRRILSAIIPLIVGTLLSAPTMLPMYVALHRMSRAEGFGIAEFLERGIPLPVLLEWWCPLLRIHTDFLRDRASIVGYQGAWIVGGLIAGLLALCLWRTPAGDEPSNQPPRRRIFGGLLGLATVFTLLALGGYGWLYPLTYGLPVWSSFRWPFKFFLLSQVLVALAASVGLEIGMSRMNGRRWWRGVIVGVPLLVASWLLLQYGAVPWQSVGGWLCVVTAITAIVLVGWCDRQWSKVALVVVGALSAAMVMVTCHQPGLKIYHERYGEAPGDVLGIDPAWRILPLTASGLRGANGYQMQYLGLFHAATINGYFSATGNTTAGLTAKWFAMCLPCKVNGTLPYGITQQMLPSHLLRTFNVKYVLAAPEDRMAQALVADAGGYRMVRKLPQVIVYENEDALPRAYFASEVRPFSFPAMREGLLENKASLTTAYVDQWLRPMTVAQADIKRMTFTNSSATFEVAAPNGGFLVFSERYDPGWSAVVDGQVTKVYQVNLTLMGVKIPASASTVVFRYRTPGLQLATGLALFGIALLAGWLWWGSG